MKAETGPALTPEQWAKKETAQGRFGDEGVVFISERDDHEVCVVAGGASYTIADPHACAALCLHGQPFGFTWEDVRKLREAAEYEERDRGQRPFSVLGDLADRIEALLSPEST